VEALFPTADAADMAGQLKSMIERVVRERAKGSPTLAVTTRAKLMLKGIPVNDFTDQSPDDPEMIRRVRVAAGEMGVSV
jgi:hypothetical protein